MLTMRQEYIRQRIQGDNLTQIVVPVNSSEITLHKDAAVVLEKAGKQLASDAHLPFSLVAERLFDFVYRFEPSGVLVFVLYIPEREVEILIELPKKYWKFSRNEKRIQTRAVEKAQAS